MSLAGALLLLASAAGGKGCALPAGEAAAQAALSYADFDAKGDALGWRTLNAAGCTDAAIALLRAWRAAHAARLAPEQRDEIGFHIVQALAMAGRRAEALAAIPEADGGQGTAEWRAYVAATRAWLARDPAALAAARAAYAAARGMSADRLAFIDGFIACPDKGYMEAAMCAAAR